MPDISKQKMTAEELRKARVASEQMGDIEFQMEIAPYFDYAADIDPSKARYRGIEGLPGDVELTLGGFAVSEEDPNEPFSPSDLKPYQGRVKGVEFEVPVEPGTVNAVHSKATPNIWAHEYRHQMKEDGNGETFNRLADAAVAQNEDDWDAAVTMWRDQLRRRGKEPSMSEAERDLIKRLETNSMVTPRGVYGADYDRGARNPAAEGLVMHGEKGEYTQDRIKKSFWKRRASELEEFDDWSEELAERNKERQGGN
jgi:hypothetical protein